MNQLLLNFTVRGARDRARVWLTNYKGRRQSDSEAAKQLREMVDDPPKGALTKQIVEAYGMKIESLIERANRS